ncbi:hypothetical protein ACFIOY_29115 [Bradyrhizobium sp. TZ2]
MIKGPFLFCEKGTPGIQGRSGFMAIEPGWQMLHESGTYVKFTQPGADLFA